MQEIMVTKILCLSDLHCGSLLGLTPPEYQSVDTRCITGAMWDWYVDALDFIGKVDVCVLNGDAVDGEGKKETIGLITTDTQRQAEIALDCLSNVRTDKFYLVYGTPFHVTGSYNYEEPIASALNCPIRDTILLEVKGKKFNFRHVAGRSDVPYGQGTQLFKEAVRDLLQASIEKYEAADYIVRGHVHYYCRVENAKTCAISLPCFQVPDGVFGRRMRALYYDIGMVLFDVMDDGEVIVHKYIMPLKLVRKREYECIGETLSKSKSRKK
jgi:hypothetical protein